MTSGQKIIKYFALALAAVIIVNVISMIFFGVYQLSNIFGTNSNGKDKISEIEIKDANSISSLDIDLAYTDLEIKSSEQLRIETNNKNIICKEQSYELVVEERNSNWFSNKKNKKLVLYLPSDTFEKIKIEAGAGKIDIYSINTKNLELEIGVGEVSIQKLIVLEKAKIDGGVGKTVILDGEIHHLDLEMGVGEFEITSKLTGNSSIESGVGNLIINLLEQKENYTFKVEKGLGTIKIDGEKVASDMTYGTGDNLLEVEGGIGDIKINTKKDM